jgi:glucose-6-phosphate 1-dehydrogenase
MNLLRESLRLPHTPEPCTLVVFGTSGDLTRRKLMPVRCNPVAKLHLRHGILG